MFIDILILRFPYGNGINPQAQPLYQQPMMPIPPPTLPQPIIDLVDPFDKPLSQEDQNNDFLSCKEQEYADWNFGLSSNSA